MTFVDPHAPDESSNEGSRESSQERVQKRAYELWEQEGRPGDRAVEHWTQAEREVLAQPADHPPGEDRSGAVAPPTQTQEEGSTGESGTPSATAVKGGRDRGRRGAKSSRAKTP